MNKWFNFAAQILGFAGQVAVPMFVHRPEKLVMYNGGISLAQGAIGYIAHFYNPDGTSARSPYIPEGKL